MGKPSKWGDSHRLDFLMGRPWLAVLSDANTGEGGVVDRKAGDRITGSHDTYREAIDEAIRRLRTW